MSSYEILDKIADSYNPTLFLAYLVMAVIYWRQGDRLASLKGLVGILIAYGFMFLDNAAHVWSLLGMNYSTHSAVALVLIIFHVHKKQINSAPAIGLMGSLVAYYALEVYQKYHTASDILSTACVVGAVTMFAYWFISVAVSNKPVELLN